MNSQRKPLAHGTQHHCFGCGPDNESGLQLNFYPDESASDPSSVHCQFLLDARFMGPPGHAHGGIIATILDEAMSKANRHRSVFAMTGKMEVEYLRPVPLLTPLTVAGRSASAGPARKHHCTAEIVDGRGHVLAKARGLFIEVKPERLLHRQSERQ